VGWLNVLLGDWRQEIQNNFSRQTEQSPLLQIKNCFNTNYWHYFGKLPLWTEEVEEGLIKPITMWGKQWNECSSFSGYDDLDLWHSGEW
jgi:hypothetical protein